VPVAYSYIRFSTTEQQKGDSLRRQTEASAKYAAAHGLTLDDSLTAHDLGVSAFSGANFESGALGRFILAIDEGRVVPGSYLLVESLDRLSRLPVPEALAIFQSIISRGIVIVTLTDMAVYSKERLKTDWTPLLIALVSMSRAHEESAVKSQRVRAAWNAKKERIKVTKEAMSGRCPWWLRLSADGKKYELIEENAKIVRELFDMARSGMGGMSIGQHLTKLQVPTPQHSKYWQKSTVLFTLRNIATIGVLQLDQDNNGQTTTDTFIEDYYPPVIDKELFFSVQSIITERHRAPGNGAGRVGQCYNIFKGTAKCGRCGSPMHIRRKPGINTGFLYCAKALSGAGCVGVSYNIRQLEAEFISFTRELDLAHVLGDDSSQQAVDAKKMELAACVGELDAAQSRFGNLLKAVEVGGDVTALVQRLRDVESALNELKKRRIELQTELEALMFVKESESSSYANLNSFMEQLQSKESSLDEKLKLRFKMLAEVQRVVSKLLLFPGGRYYDEWELALEAERLTETGYDEARVNAHLESLPTKPDREERYFIAFMRNGIVRTVKQGKVLEVDKEWRTKLVKKLEARAAAKAAAAKPKVGRKRKKE
jgi:DNA invertase Pin-like site-specific DNA recombinase